VKIALVGEQQPDVIAHIAIPLAIDLAARDLSQPCHGVWLPTDRVGCTNLH